MALRVGDPESIGGYRLLGRLGAGGMGTVYLAQAESGRKVAVKVVHQQFAEDFEFRTRFRQEVAAARRVSGAFTAPVVDADADAPRPWMATQYIPGSSLGNRVRRDGPLTDPAELRLLAVGLVEALRDIHKVGVIHRDLKPDNVLLTDDGPRVIDFGISRAADQQTLTVTGRILGTPPFMSPEQLSSPHRVRAASDVFSLGAVLVYATCGHGPFDADNHYLTAYNVVHEPAAVAHLSGTVREIIQWCLAKQPSERPGLDDLLKAFRAAPEDDWGIRPLLSPVHEDSAPRATPRVWWRRRPIAALAATATVAATVTTTWGLGLWDQDAGTPRDPAAAPASTPTSETRPPAVEKRAALRPAGWSLWQNKLTERETNIKRCEVSPTVLLCASGNDRLAAFDTDTGKRLWHKPFTDPAQGQFMGMATTGARAYYVETANDGPESTRIRAIAPASGKVLWSTPPRSVAPFTETFAYVPSAVVALDPAQRLQAWDPESGRPLWTEGINGDPQSFRLLVSQDRLYLEEWHPDRERYMLFEVDAQSGKKSLTATYDTERLVLIAEKSIVVRQADGSLVIVRNDGTRITTTLPDTPYIAEADGIVYLRMRDGMVVAANAVTGKRLWAKATKAEADEFAAPVMARDGRIYLTDDRGRVLCLSAAEKGRILWQSAARMTTDGYRVLLLSVTKETVYISTLERMDALQPPS
ncbi:PQQ-binding-like beta-propeller repeat protein [Streptomyces sp. N35]|uniref:serine/threonine-protein kinase n=1 Tax=Streptomyces sp. N35 TaxID=2795730 RepID=UPI0018F39AF0|nr:serine/threonine-protein kinase [Streptomyces sp. N35]